MTDNQAGEWDSYVAEYCENCGQVFSVSDEIENTVEEPVHRMDILKAIGPIDEVAETTATEERKCECTGASRQAILRASCRERP